MMERAIVGEEPCNDSDFCETVQDLALECPDNWAQRDGLCVADARGDLPDPACDVKLAIQL